MGAPRTIRKANDKFDKNISKRGNVPIGKAATKTENEYPTSKVLIAFFLIVVVGSSVVQVLNLFLNSKSSSKTQE